MAKPFLMLVLHQALEKRYIDRPMLKAIINP